MTQEPEAALKKYGLAAERRKCPLCAQSFIAVRCKPQRYCSAVCFNRNTPKTGRKPYKKLTTKTIRQTGFSGNFWVLWCGESYSTIRAALNGKVRSTHRGGKSPQLMSLKASGFSVGFWALWSGVHYNTALDAINLKTRKSKGKINVLEMAKACGVHRVCLTNAIKAGIDPMDREAVLSFHRTRWRRFAETIKARLKVSAEAKAATRRARRKVWRANPHNRVRQNLGSRLSRAIRAAGGCKDQSILRVIGCTMPELNARLERLFLRGMTWKNYGKVWHVDHIVPCAYFDLTKPEEQRRCFHFSNLRPLWAEQNIRESNRRGQCVVPLGI